MTLDAIIGSGKAKDDDGFCRETAATMQPQPGRPRIVVFSTWNSDYSCLADIARPNWVAYCKRHGYGLRFYPGEFHLNPKELATYGDKGKFRLYYDLRGHADYVMWLDIDSLFMNHDIKIEDRMGQRFVWTYDDSGPLSGLWIAGTDAVTEKHLRYAYEKAAIENNVRHGVIETNGISDQDAMRSLMAIPPFEMTFANCQPAMTFGHCFPENYYDGAWIITFPGRPLNERIALMQEWAAKT